MPSMYASYIYERHGKSIVETDSGFATFMYPNESTVYLEDLYVKSALRRSGAATQLVDEVVRIAKLKGCHTLLGSVCATANNSTDSLKAVLSYGMKLHASDNILIWFKKEI